MDVLLPLPLPPTDDIVAEANADGRCISDRGHLLCDGHVHKALETKHKLSGRDIGKVASAIREADAGQK